jgi:transcriptional regulator GlxA family with amidase domain
VSTTPLLGITELTPNQTGKETTVNDAIVALEAAGNATLAVSMAAGDVTLSVNQFTRSFLFRCSATPTSF